MGKCQRIDWAPWLFLCNSIGSGTASGHQQLSDNLSYVTTWQSCTYKWAGKRETKEEANGKHPRGMRSKSGQRVEERLRVQLVRGEKHSSKAGLQKGRHRPTTPFPLCTFPSPTKSRTRHLKCSVWHFPDRTWRTNGPTDRRTIGPMDQRTNGLSLFYGR